MRRTIFTILIVTVIVLVGLFLAYRILKKGFDEVETSKVPIMSQCKNKIVYTLDMDADKMLLQEDCLSRRGYFNLCGSVCSAKGRPTITVCAYTCELK
ncbi:MAG: hypothetical protein PHV78_02010 [Patescibacteria group bacterium]|nr:hypothetical protein [Patescibacteria group bacterium]MDD5121076.1 hypothetical protein [Patescibacteria group bacterium]MDD5221562.1 hypothetical protein [Patescibacteria group bacterium]MDD5396005.1 hypothetical protein [Patescibacteria group bacterium]